MALLVKSLELALSNNYEVSASSVLYYKSIYMHIVIRNLAPGLILEVPYFLDLFSSDFSIKGFLIVP